MGKREIVKWIFIGIFAGLLILAALGGWMHWKNSPKQAVEKFVKAVQKEKWEEAWECLRLPDSPFLSSDALGEALEKGPMAGLKSFQVKKIGETEFTVSYEGSGGQEEEIVFQTEANGWDGIWKRRKIVSPRFWAEDIQVEAYSSLKVQVDGILLTEEEEASREENTVTYRIPHLFLGTHQVGAQGEDEGFARALAEVEIYRDRQFVMAEAGEPVGKEFEALKDQTLLLWRELLEGILKEELPGIVQENSSGQRYASIFGSSIEQAYFTMGLYYGEGSLEELELLSGESRIAETGYQEGKLWVRVEASGQVLSERVYYSDAWDMPVYDYHRRRREKRERSVGEKYFAAVFIKEDGEWRLMDIDGVGTGGSTASGW